MTPLRSTSLALVLLASSGCGQGPAPATPAPAAPVPAPQVALSPAPRAVPQATATISTAPSLPPTARQVTKLADAPGARPALLSWALDPRIDRERRYAALRRLEEWRDPATVAAALALAQGTDELLRANGVATLVRLAAPGFPGASEAQAQLQRLEGEAAALAQALWSTGAR